MEVKLRHSPGDREAASAEDDQQQEPATFVRCRSQAHLQNEKAIGRPFEQKIEERMPAPCERQCRNDVKVEHDGGRVVRVERIDAEGA